MNKSKPPTAQTKAREERAKALLRYLLSVYGPKEIERLRKEYYLRIK